mmetsp:Transcript_78934/g.218415  ORF Transcript_78934/g.218415 Transcript_78934/m.218415 type:complete len:348 (-) Transcript_78934:446-1489(-)
MAMPVASVRSLAFAVRTFSRSCMTFAGEKKWHPMTREGSFSTEAMSSMLRPLVLVQMSASGRMCFSMSRKTCRLRSMISGTASITMSTSAKSSYFNVGVTRLMSCLNLASVMRPLWAWPCQRAAIFLTPSSSHSGLASFRTTETPFSAKHMAMPPPMRPAPNIPTFFSGAGGALTPGTFCAKRSAKKRCRNAADCTPKTNFVNSFASTAVPSSKLNLEQAALRQLQIAVGATMPGAWLAAMSSPCSSAPIPAIKRFWNGTGRLEMGLGGLPRASAAASATTSPLLATPSTMPSFAACSIGTGFPRMIICMACCNGATRGKRCVPCAPGRRPRFTSGKPTTVFGTATR